MSTELTLEASTQRSDRPWGLSGIRRAAAGGMVVRHQAGLPQCRRRASLLLALETVSCWLWKLSLALLSGPHILGESRSCLDPTPVAKWRSSLSSSGVSRPRQVPQGGLGGEDEEVRPLPRLGHTHPYQSGRAPDLVKPQLLGREVEAQAE